MSIVDIQAEVLRELDAELGRLLDRHIAAAKEWFPHQLVPWSTGRDYIEGCRWDDVSFPLQHGVRSALLVNLLTEDNLPYYFEVIVRHSSRDGAWGEWARRWTAEETRHSTVIRDYLLVMRALDPVLLERARMQQMSHGFDRHFPSPIHGAIYTTVQELATRIAHNNTGKLLPDPPGREVMRRVAADENLHYLLYRDLCSAMLERWPSYFVQALKREVQTFKMPGVEIQDFPARTMAIGAVGIYDLLIHHDQILHPLIHRHWRIPEIDRLDPEADKAREQLLAHLDRLRRLGVRLRERANHVQSVPSVGAVGAYPTNGSE